ncbi:MAG: sugar transferase [Chloroflexota bacterium]|nr:sugar transferase [Chloroflexota bacterium]
MGTSPRVLSVSERVYRLLLVAYPAEFRRIYGPHMAQVFRDCCREAHARRSTRGVIELWMHTLRDLAATAPRERISEIAHKYGRNSIAIKRLFDIIVSITVLLFMAPIFLMIAVSIKLDSAGPIFYTSRRIGRNGKPFEMYKFRTMAGNAGPGGPRITRVGRFLRQATIDEWPQLFNVLKGEMSLVGPRPEVRELVDLQDPLWQQVLSMRPGMTGLAQWVSMEQKAAIGAPAKQELDLQYLQNRSWLFDLQLIRKTFLVLVRPRRNVPPGR